MTRAVLFAGGALVFFAALFASGVLSSSPEEPPPGPEARARELLARAGNMRELGLLDIHGGKRLGDRGREADAEEIVCRGMEKLTAALDDYTRAIALLEEAGAPAPAIADARAARALVHFDLGHSTLALLEATEALELAGGAPIPDAHLARALSLFQLGDFRAAARAVDDLLTSGSGPEHRGLGVAVYRELAQWYRATLAPDLGATIGCLHRAYEIDPDPVSNAGPREELLSLEAEYHREVDAIRHEADSSGGEAELALALVHAKYGRYPAAERLFRSLMDIERVGRSPRLLLLEARHLWEGRDTPEALEEAERLVREALEAAPDDPDAAAALRRVVGRRRSLEASLAR